MPPCWLRCVSCLHYEKDLPDLTSRQALTRLRWLRGESACNRLCDLQIAVWIALRLWLPGYAVERDWLAVDESTAAGAALLLAACLRGRVTEQPWGNGTWNEEEVLQAIARTIEADETAIRAAVAQVRAARVALDALPGLEPPLTKVEKDLVCGKPHRHAAGGA